MKIEMLKFEDFNSAKNYLYNLKGKEIDTTGNWSYYQILHHLADSLEYTFRGGITDISIPSFMQPIGKLLLMKFFFQGFMDSNLPNPIRKNTIILGNTEEEYNRLLHLIDDFENFKNSYYPHPIFGNLSREEWRKLHAYHFANHLSYVVIKNESTINKS